MARDEGWNPWHGCKKISEGCLNCYVYRRDSSVGRDASIVTRSKRFEAPLARDRHGAYKIAPGTELFACMTSDFFLDEADLWRPAAWEIIRARRDISFHIITKRIVRMGDCLPPDWGDGYENVTIGCTVESRRQCEKRMPVFVSLPIRRRFVVCEPLLTPVDLTPYLNPRKIGFVVVGGESGEGARPMDYAWVLDIRAQCVQKGVRFRFKQTGANFIKEGKRYAIPRKDQMAQARRAGIDT